MIIFTQSFNLNINTAVIYLLAIELLSDLIGIIAFKYLTFKNNYLNISIKFVIRIILYTVAFITNSIMISFIALTWAILISTSYENVIEAPFINKIDNEYQMIFANIRTIIKLIAISIGVYIAGILYSKGVPVILGIAAIFTSMQTRYCILLKL